MSNTRNLGDIGRNTALKGLGDDNLIINGNFDIWQRGTSFSDFAFGTYTADRWVVYHNTTGASRTISRQAFTLGQTDVPNEPEYFLRYNQSVAGSGATFCNIAQNIEDVRTLAGQTVTLSFWAKFSSSYNMFVGVIQNFGTGGSPSSIISADFGTASLTTSWAKYTFTTTLPSISGKTLGTDNNDHLYLYFILPINSIFTFDIAQVKLEPGDTATDFVPRRIEDELAKCQRYYCRTFFNVRSTSPGSGSYYENAIYWPQQMRGIPTTTLDTTQAFQCTPTVDNPDQFGARATILATASGDVRLLRGAVTADAEL